MPFLVAFVLVRLYQAGVFSTSHSSTHQGIEAEKAIHSVANLNYSDKSSVNTMSVGIQTISTSEARKLMYSITDSCRPTHEDLIFVKADAASDSTNSDCKIFSQKVAISHQSSSKITSIKCGEYQTPFIYFESQRDCMEALGNENEWIRIKFAHGLHPPQRIFDPILSRSIGNKTLPCQNSFSLRDWMMWYNEFIIDSETGNGKQTKSCLVQVSLDKQTGRKSIQLDDCYGMTSLGFDNQIDCKKVDAALTRIRHENSKNLVSVQ